MVTSAQHLRDQIDVQLEEFASLEELSDARYHETHERFEAASNQRTLILEWLEGVAGRMSFPADREARALSVGCGGGVMDEHIAHVFSEHADALSLAGIDPNAEHTEAFMKRFADEGFDVEVFTGLFEEYEQDRSFDIIHFVHCLYYFEHIEPELRKAVEMLAPGGAMIVLQAPNMALNHLADRIWKKQFDQSAWYSDEVVKVLKKMNVDFEIDRIKAEVDVTECFVPESELGRDILDFVVQAETRQFSPTLQASLRESLRESCQSQGQRVLCEHPVDGILIRKQK